MTAAPYLREIESRLPRLTAILLAVAAALAFVMAILAPINHRPDLWRGPPDEHSHRGSARYYVEHWIPPKVGASGTLESYSLDYGYSYINDPDPVYLFAGKFAALLSPIVTDLDRGFRLFNAALLAALAAIAFARPRAWLVFVPLLLSPQIWYLFSYFNNDAFPIFLSVVLAWQVADRESLFNRFLDAPGWGRYWMGALLVAVLAGLLILSKKNYLAFLALLPAAIALVRFDRASPWLLVASAFAGAAWYLKWWDVDAAVAVALGVAAAALTVALVLLAPQSREARRRAVAKLVVLAAIAGALAGGRYAWDLSLHGSMEAKLEAMGKLQEEIAKPDYKPSVIYSQARKQSYYGIELRARGTPLSELFSPKWSWHSLTFATATGSYGWIQFTAGTWYYALMLVCFAAIFGIYARGAARSGYVATAGLALVSIFSALTLTVAIWHSWNNDFQAQGRYLFPVIAMLGLGLHLARERLPLRAFAAAAGFCFLLGLYSYLFIGLTHVPGSF